LLLAAAGSIALFAVVAHNLNREHEIAVEAARAKTQNLARMLEEHARQNLQRVESSLLRAVDEVRRSGDLDRADRAALRGRLNMHLPLDGSVRTLVVADRNGAIMVSTAVEGKRVPLSIADREYFTALRDHSDLAMMIGTPVRSYRTDQWVLPVSYRLTAADRGFEGLIVAMVEPAYFQSFYDSIDVGANGFVAIFLRSGWIAVLWPASERLLTRNWADSPMFSEHLPRSGVGTVREVVVADGVERITSYRALNAYPVVVAVGVSLSDALAGWRTRAWRQSILLLVALIILSTAAFMLTRQLRRREAADAALQASEERFRTLADAAPMMVWMSGTDKLFTYFNRRRLEFRGRTLEQEQRKSWVEGIHPEDAQRCLTVYETAFEARREFEMEYRLQRSDGAYRSILGRGVPLFASSGAFLGYIGSCIDITERKRAEDERLRLEREILQIDEAQQRRIGRELHDELGQQLTSIALMAKVVEHKLRDKGGEADEIKRIVEAVNQATSFTRSLAKGLNPVDLAENGLMGALEQMAATLSSRVGVKCSFCCDKPVLVHDNAVATHLYRIAQEAVNNALKHSRAKRIDIELQGGAGGLRLSVSDDGVGFAAQGPERDRGMGLEIMRFRVDAIDGAMEIRARKPSGTVVSVTLADALRERPAE
jgi:PAS domain S-box-containing protein